jgi:hypothetical protein
MIETAITFVLVCIMIYLLIDQRRTDKRAFDAYAKAGPSQHCMTCGEDFKPPIQAPLRGSGLVELALWFTLVGGLIYSIWRRSSSFKLVCPVCKAATVVPIDSKAAKAHNAALIAIK